MSLTASAQTAPKGSFAPAPYNWTSSGKPGSNGDFNIYVIDRDGRKIAAVWGRRGDKEATAHLFSASADLLTAAKEAAVVIAEFARAAGANPMKGTCLPRLMAAIQAATGAA